MQRGGRVEQEQQDVEYYEREADLRAYSTPLSSFGECLMFMSDHS